MTPSEFKAWFEGFCEGIDGAPSKEQFERIKERVEKIAAVRVEYLPSLPIQPTTVRPYWMDIPVSNIHDAVPPKEIAPFLEGWGGLGNA